MNIRDLVKRGKELYSNKSMRKQWVRKTIVLHERGRHAHQTGGWVNGGK
jgi:hypothetical protein